MSRESEIVNTGFIRHQEIKATVVRACTNCNAPGTFVKLNDYWGQWLGCCVGESSPKLGKEVGEYCPNCGSIRPSSLTEDRGIIWEKWVFASIFQKLKFDFKCFVRRILNK